MKIETYIKPGDQVQVIPRSVKLDPFYGQVVSIGNEVPGTREFLVVPAGKTLLEDGAFGVKEQTVMFKVLRGESWVFVPNILCLEEAIKKSERNAANQRKRIDQAVPLFADQIEVEVRDPSHWILCNIAGDEAQLQRQHDNALLATSLRDKVRTLVTANEYAQLSEKRSRRPDSPDHGLYFWEKQLEHINATGRPDIFVPQVTLAKKLSIPWLILDSHVTWTTAPGGPKQVKVDFIGSDSVMAQVQGQPFRDYDPALIPHPTVWLKPEDMAPSLPAGRN
jgi:hypothetical protein